MYKRIIGEVANSTANKIIGKQDFQKDIFNIFKDFFDNIDHLERYSNDYLIQDYINYTRNNLHVYKSSLLEVRSLFSKAKTCCAEKTYIGVARFQPISVQMGNKHWSMLKLQNDFSKLEDYEYVYECFSLIEHICESILKPLLALMVYLNRIVERKEVDFDSINHIKFGNLVNELKQSNKLNSVINILNSNVSISQWRNIACHKNFQYINGKIQCQYGENLDKNETIDSKEKLLHITKSLYTIAQVLLLPSKFFLYDNIESIRNKMDELSIDITDFRNEDWQLIYVTEMLANGFVVTDINNIDKLIITVADTKKDENYERITLIPIAAYKAWVLTEKEEIEIIYISNDGAPYVSIKLTGDVCEKVSSYEKNFSYLAEKMIIKKY
jgi:hypothetical protein